jgi:hypothetical protein
MVWHDAPLETLRDRASHFHVELSIREPATNEVVAIGETGEICARGCMNMLGYPAIATRRRRRWTKRGGSTGDLDAWMSAAVSASPGA